MDGTFAGSEIAEIAVEIERNGKDFYTTLAGQSKDERAKGIFGYLADEEAKHIAAFREILDSVKSYEPKEAYPVEYFAYMRALAEEHVFTRKNTGAEVAEKVKTDKAKKFNTLKELVNELIDEPFLDSNDEYKKFAEEKTKLELTDDTIDDILDRLYALVDEKKQVKK